MTRYIEAFSWPSNIQRFLEEIVIEKPLLNVCSGKSKWGDTTVDLYMPSDLNVDWLSLPYADDSYGAVFADPPWNSGYKQQCAAFMRRALRIAPVVYLMAPWLYGSAEARLTKVWVRQIPGVNQIVGITRYERSTNDLVSTKKVVV